MFCLFSPFLSSVSQKYTHVETCSNVKVQKGAVKCYPKKMFIFKVIFFCGKTCISLSLVFKIVITWMSYVWKACKCCKCVSLSIVGTVLRVSFHVLSFNPVLKHATYLEWIEGGKLSSDIFRAQLYEAFPKEFLCC